MPHFLGLPPEIRNMIYGYCLVVPREIMLLPSCYDNPRLELASHPASDAKSRNHNPNLALLRVNKQINAESELIWYGRNIWRIETPWVFDGKAALFRDVTVSLDFRDLDLDWLADELDNRDESLEEPCQGGYDPDSPDRQAVIHDRRVGILLDGEWGVKMNALDKMDLDTAVIDIKRCWCFHGCCRLIDPLDMTEIKAKKITIMCVYNEVGYKQRSKTA
ncbi:MAG: hypothetical protein L6R42_006288 [Xanthoria sp. 1 TBL-2021]|nr:MAG: hypothetical protein L6R42_006288 [Xanthoria sp. 1 TBL-2021]